MFRIRMWFVPMYPLRSSMTMSIFTYSITYALCKACLVIVVSTQSTIQSHIIVEIKKYVDLFSKFHWKFVKGPLGQLVTNSDNGLAQCNIPSHKTNSLQVLKDKFKCIFCLLYKRSCKIIISQDGYWMANATNVLIIVDRLSYKHSIVYINFQWPIIDYEHHKARYCCQRANPSITKN